MRNSIGTAVVLLKAPLGGFRGGLRGSDTGSEPAGLTDSVTNSYCSNRILYSACDYDLFTYQLLNILWSFTFITYDTLDNMISLSLLYSFVWTFFFFSNPSKINKKKKDKFLSNICCIRLEMDTVSLPIWCCWSYISASSCRKMGSFALLRWELHWKMWPEWECFSYFTFSMEGCFRITDNT